MMVKQLCTVARCERERYSLGLCNTHYRRMRKGKLKMCEARECDRPLYAKGLCHAHWKRKRRGQDSTVPIGKLEHPNSGATEVLFLRLRPAEKKQLEQLAAAKGSRPGLEVRSMLSTHLDRRMAMAHEPYSAVLPVASTKKLVVRRPKKSH